MPTTAPTGWTLDANALTRTCKRADFTEALAFVVEIGRLAEAADHHPDIDVRYRNVHLSLSTHAAGNKVTEKDFALAQQINDLADDSIRHTKDELQRRFRA